MTPTPIERRGDIWIKRDDLFEYGGVAGGKVRTCVALARGAKGLITAGSRQSPQVNIVAHIAAAQGIPARLHVPAGALTPELNDALHCGPNVHLIQHRPGYNSVIVARAIEDAAARRDYTYIPFGMECPEAVRQTAGQVVDLPEGIKRIVMPVGSGMSLAGVLAGLGDRWITVVGVRVGANPDKRLDSYAPLWRLMPRLFFVDAGIDYHKPAPVTEYHGLKLDPIYEAKCLPFLEPDDLLWVVGIRKTAQSA